MAAGDGGGQRNGAGLGGAGGPARATFFTKETVKVIGQMMGYQESKLEDAVAAAIAQDTEFKIRELIEDGKKFARHSHRDCLLPADVDHALRLRNVEPLYGFSDHRSFKRIPQEDLFYVEDAILSLKDVFQEPQPKVPPDASVHLHWLAIAGSQPHVPENPNPANERMDEEKEDVEEDGEEAGSDDGGEAPRNRASSRASPLASSRQVRVPLVEHVLSKEQQMFYIRVADAIKGADERLRAEALRCLRQDAGLHQLLPYFVKFITDEVLKKRTNLRVLTALMRMAAALVHSQHLQIEPYLHQLMPAVLTCVVGKGLCAVWTEDHWSLREFAAKLVAVVCRKYGAAYVSLQPRVTKTYAGVFHDASKSLSQHYGAIVGLSVLGKYVRNALLMPHIETFMALLQDKIDKAADAEEPRRVLLQVNFCQNALLSAAGAYVRTELSQLRVEDLFALKSTEDEGEGGNDEEEEEEEAETKKKPKRARRGSSRRGTKRRKKAADDMEEEEEEEEEEGEGEEGDGDEGEELKKAGLPSAETLFELFGEGILPSIEFFCPYLPTYIK